MKNSSALIYLQFSFIFMIAVTASGQARLIFNGAHIVFAKNVILVVANDSSNAITRINGSIISEGEGNNVQWMIGETTGTYTIPWSNGTTYMPLTFTKSAGSGNGNFIFSTFPTTAQNSLKMPSGVTNLNRGGNDKSLSFIDRFWQLNAQNYASKPSITNVQFGYIDAEHELPNNILELALSIVSWKEDTESWVEYDPAGDPDIAINNVMVDSIPGSELYSWWSLKGEVYLLPGRFLSFSAGRQGTTARLVWKTANEVGLSDFEVQRSVNGNAYTSIGRTPANAASGAHVYLHTDASPARGSNAYRIKEAYKNGTFFYSEIRTIVMDNNPGGVVIYPNPVTGNSFTINATGIPAGTYNIQLYGVEGKLIASFVKELSGNHVIMRLEKSIGTGIYLLRLTSGKNTFSTRFLMSGN